MNGIFKRTLCMVFSIALLFSALSFNAFALTDEEELKQLDDKVQSIRAEIEAGKATKSAELDIVAAQQKQIEIYDKQITDLDSQISEKEATSKQLSEDIEFLQKEIDEAAGKIDEQNQNILDTYAALAERMRAVYMSGEASTLEVLLTSPDYETFLTRLELMFRISKHDDELVNNFKDAVTTLNKTKDGIVINQSQIQEKMADNENKKAEIKAQRADIAELRRISESKKQSSEDIIKSIDESDPDAQKRLSDAEDEYDKKFESIGSSGSGELPTEPPTTERPTEKPTEKPTKPVDSETTKPSGGQGSDETTTEKPTEPGGGSGGSEIGNYPVSKKGMIMPLQYDNVYISAGWFGYENHRGIDFCTRGATGNTFGKDIRAAASGTVLSAEYHYSWGYNVYIDHGNGVHTRYAHCSKMLVSVGQKVKQGQKIAEVGNSGNVSPKPTPGNPHAGAHLHFEVWINGTRVNPAPWLP